MKRLIEALVMIFCLMNAESSFAQRTLNSMNGAMEGYVSGTRDRDAREAEVDRINSEVRSYNNQIRRDKELSSSLSASRERLKSVYEQLEQMRKNESVVSMYATPSLSECNSYAEKLKKKEYRGELTNTIQKLESEYANQDNELKFIVRQINEYENSIIRNSSSMEIMSTVERKNFFTDLGIHAQNLSLIYLRNKYTLVQLFQCLRSVPSNKTTSLWEIRADTAMNHFLFEEMRKDIQSLSQSFQRLARNN